MQDFRFYIIFLAALVPLLTGFIYYNPKVFGNAWMKASGMTPDAGKDTNMAKVFILCYILSVFIAFGLISIVIHQFGAYSAMLAPDIEKEGTELNLYMKDFMNRFGSNYRTFKHGALHGTLAGLMLAMPIVGINALFEKKSFKYVMLHTGYWVLTLALMGGVICQWM